MVFNDRTPSLDSRGSLICSVVQDISVPSPKGVYLLAFLLVQKGSLSEPKKLLWLSGKRDKN